MNITIIGAGAIGGVIGGYLGKAGEQVTFVDIDADHVEKMRMDGLTINGVETFTVPVRAFTTDELLARKERLETVFLCVKAQHTREAVESIQHLLTPASVVVSFQNGLCEQEIAGLIGQERTVGCFVNLFADYLEPGLIEYGGVGSVYLGELDGTVSPRVHDLVGRLRAWGTAHSTDNIWGYLWSKLAYGAVLTATALTNETIADVLSTESNRLMLLDLAAEVLAVADQQGVVPMGFDGWEPALAYPVSSRDWDEINRQLDKLVARLRTYTKTRTGIWRDLAVRKRKTEVPYHLKPVIAAGEAAGLEMRLTKATLLMIQEIEQGNRNLSLHNLDELHTIHRQNTGV
ncbi:ketopantoate reductase family protein [Paenactinomyces guangxiensis]|uniref:Ketopantoate reductase family protein n=1 Tax=Paenactinomyces guangxiensis TaxID=1490290 RepID=A0A7W1WQP2_9BACL|nr:2-dehydropantoate 2-reductase N-terminal domain-containing protein [Paenactinomyces guangxiensis]MBA4494319.1 ketopantoate reductase family protein [Paenactinomyces guangxiensis]MBH8590814.1 ketopantoate reductase family protein [Paenactinomyces guangxiensis]